jgi:hypothetical protein
MRAKIARSAGAAPGRFRLIRRSWSRTVERVALAGFGRSAACDEAAGAKDRDVT